MKNGTKKATINDALQILDDFIRIAGMLADKADAKKKNAKTEEKRETTTKKERETMGIQFER